MAESMHSNLTDEHSTLQLVTRFGEAFAAHDVDAMMQLMTEDCIFENTFPAPDGTRYEGKPAVRAFWEDFFQTSRQPKFQSEEIFELGDRCIVRWIYYWQNEEGIPGHVRGIDVFRVRDGFIHEKLSYVKG